VKGPPPPPLPQAPPPSVQCVPRAVEDQSLCAGKRPDERCPSCGCLVHATAFHSQERLTTFYVGESVLGWDKANHAGNMVRPCTLISQISKP